LCVGNCIKYYLIRTLSGGSGSVGDHPRTHPLAFGELETPQIFIAYFLPSTLDERYTVWKWTFRYAASKFRSHRLK
jgi:hypothetical protein